MFETILTKEALEKAYVQDKQPKAVIAKKFGTTVSTVYKYMRKHGISTLPPAEMLGEDLTGKVFGKLTAKKRGSSDFHKNRIGFVSALAGRSVQSLRRLLYADFRSRADV